jgi:glycerate kinase
MRAAPAVLTGEGSLDAQSLLGKVVGEIGTRCRQGGVPLHAIVGRNELDAFEARTVDLQTVREATTLQEISDAAQAVGLEIAP